MVELLVSFALLFVHWFRLIACLRTIRRPIKSINAKPKLNFRISSTKFDINPFFVKILKVQALERFVRKKERNSPIVRGILHARSVGAMN